MSKRDENYYFQNFVTSANCALRAAQVLKDTLMEFHPSQLEERLSEMHAIENEGDSQRHEMLGVLAKEFIAPIEREDIILLSQNIDDVTDVIEDVLIRAYINNIPTVRPEALQFSDLLIRCCQLMVSLLEDFSDTFGRALASISCVLDPEVFVIGGGVSKAGPYLTQLLQKGFLTYGFPGTEQTAFTLASLGNDAGIYGAAKLILQHSRYPQAAVLS